MSDIIVARAGLDQSTTSQPDEEPRWRSWQKAGADNLPRFKTTA